MKALGVRHLRFDIEWANIEHAGPGRYDWRDYDRVVRAASARKFEILAIIDYTPAWARRPDCAGTSMCAPRDPSAFGRFAGAAAARYRPYGVRSWEIWNEPNIPAFFAPRADPAAYAALLRHASLAIRRIDSDATILTGGLAPAGDGGGAMSPETFLQRLYEAGGRPYFTAVADHPYTYPATAVYPQPAYRWEQMKRLHRIMSARGDGHKKIWITEYGAPTAGPGPRASQHAFNPAAETVDEALQARMLQDVIAAHRALPWAGPLFWYAYRDAGTDPATSENFFGLRRADGTPKPAQDVFRRALLGH